MSPRHCISLSLYLLFTACFVQCKITVEQMKQTADMIRAICQPKWNISTEMADGILEGKFPNDRVLKCYSQCVMEMSMIMKKNKMTYTAAMKSMDMLLPDDYAEGAKTGLTTCKEVGVGIKDACEAAYLIVQCIYKYNNKFTFA